LEKSSYNLVHLNLFLENKFDGSKLLEMVFIHSETKHEHEVKPFKTTRSEIVDLMSHYINKFENFNIAILFSRC